MNTAQNVVSLDSARQPEPQKLSDLFSDYATKVQMSAIDADMDLEAYLLKSQLNLLKALHLEKAINVVARLQPALFQKSLESLEGSKLAVDHLWNFGGGEFFNRHYLAVKLGRLDDRVMFQDELSEGLIIQLAMKLQDTVRWAEKEIQLQGARVK